MGRKKKEDLPDYTVADMDLDGMPWNTRKLGHAARETEQEEKKAGQWPGLEEPLTGEERRYMAWQGLKAGLLIGLVFVGAAFLFLLFCLYVWF